MVVEQVCEEDCRGRKGGDACGGLAEAVKGISSMILADTAGTA